MYTIPTCMQEPHALAPLPTNTNCLTSRLDPFPVDPNAPEETHQLTVRALVVGGILGAIGSQIAFSWEFSPNRIRSWCLQHLSRPEDRLHLRTPTFRSAYNTHRCILHGMTFSGEGHFQLLNHQGQKRLSAVARVF